MKEFLPVLIVVLISLNGCAPAVNESVVDKPAVGSNTATPQASQSIPDSTPTPADSNLAQGNVYLDSTDLVASESSPVQFTLVLKGNLPTPCDQLRVEASQPDAKNKIIVDVYSATQPDKMCAQVLEPFAENFPLGSFLAGHYTLWVNRQKVAEFDSQGF